MRTYFNVFTGVTIIAATCFNSWPQGYTCVHSNAREYSLTWSNSILTQLLISLTCAVMLCICFVHYAHCGKKLCLCTSDSNASCPQRHAKRQAKGCTRYLPHKRITFSVVKFIPTCLYQMTQSVFRSIVNILHWKQSFLCITLRQTTPIPHFQIMRVPMQKLFPIMRLKRSQQYLKEEKKNFCIQKQDKYKTTDNLWKN